MKLLPFDKFSLLSPHDRPVVIEKLQHSLAEPKFFRFRRPSESYQGRVDDEGFKISPVISYRNSFLPIIRGRFEAHHMGVKILVTQRLHNLVLGFITFWITGVMSIGGFIALESGATLDDRLFIFGMLAAAWALVTGGFWWEARHTKEELMSILDASETDT